MVLLYGREEREEREERDLSGAMKRMKLITSGRRHGGDGSDNSSLLF
jgi:hypothetical protein